MRECLVASSSDTGMSEEARAPLLVRRAGWAALGLVLAGAAYLILVRGEAIIVDLTALAGKVWCF